MYGKVMEPASRKKEVVLHLLTNMLRNGTNLKVLRYLDYRKEPKTLFLFHTSKDFTKMLLKISEKIKVSIRQPLLNKTSLRLLISTKKLRR